MDFEEMNLVSWMREKALPLWVSRGLDSENGGFVEELNEDGSASNVAFKRVRVQGRQLFCFSTAALLDWHPQAADLAHQGYSFIKEKCRAEDGHWVKRLSRKGSVLEDEIDLYDTAFIVLGLVTYYRLTQNPETLNLIVDTLTRVRTNLRTPQGKGYRQTPAEIGLLRQNPHMHWFECMLFCYEATQDRRFLEEGLQIYQLAEQIFINPQTGALRELYDPQWKALLENGKILVEPGHHYEWAWLLSRAAKIMKINPEIISKILGFADQYGVNVQTGLVWDQVTDQGVLTQPTHRLWVQTEALKALLVRKDLSESKREQRILQLENNILIHYLNREPQGSWGDRLDAEGRLQKGPVPASSMYHLMLCVTELWTWRSAYRIKP